MATTIWQQDDLHVWSNSGWCDLCIHAFVHIANDMLWLKGGSIGKNHDFTPLRLKATTKNGIPSCLRMPWNLIQGQKIFNTMDCVLEGSKLFGYNYPASGSWLWITSTRQSEFFQSSLLHIRNSSMHRGVIDLWRAWRGLYCIGVND